MLGNILSNLIGDGAASTVDAVGRALDGLFTSDDERAQAQIVLEKLRQEPARLQVELNKIEAGSRSVFVAGWRPAIGWVCAAGLGMYFLPQYALASFLWGRTVLLTGELVAYPASADGLFQLVLALLGLGGLRTFEKVVGKAK